MILLASLLSRFEMPFLRNFFEKLRTVYKLFTIRFFKGISPLTTIPFENIHFGKVYKKYYD